MKKTYVKPELYFENFELSTNIAGNCGEPTHTPSNNSCGVDVPGIGKVFLQDIVDCKYTGQDGEYSTCYHHPEDNQNLFNS